MMHVSQFLSTLGLCGATAAKAVNILEDAAIELDTLHGRQIGNGLNCILAGVVVLLEEILGDPEATPFCESILGYTTSTAQFTAVTTAYTTSTAFISEATTFDGATRIVSAFTGSPITTTVTGRETTITACISSGKLAERQVAIGAATTLSTPSALLSESPSQISVICDCLGPPTPVVTASITKTTVSTILTTVHAVVSRTNTVDITPTITPTQTITYTPTSTVNYCPPPTTPDTSCGNSGMLWALWTDYNLVAINNPEALATTPALGTGHEYPASFVGSFDGFCAYKNVPDTISIYGVELPCAYWDLQHRGYVYAGTTGDYTFTMPAGVDDEVYVWLGDDYVVRFNYTLNNAVLRDTGSFVYTAKAGEYIPLRVQFTQDIGPYILGLTITAPDGSTILDGNGQSSALVTSACDGSTPAWGTWGAEVP